MARDVKVKITCDIGGKVANAVDHDLPDDVEFDLPSGWVEVVVREVVASADYAEAKAAVDQRRAIVFAEAKQRNPGIPDAVIQRDVDAAIPDPDLPVIEVSETVHHVAPEHVAKVRKLLGGA